MKRRIALVFLFSVCLGIASVSAYQLIRPTVADTISKGAGATLKQWGAPTDTPTVMTTVPPVLRYPERVASKEPTPRPGASFAVLVIPKLNLRFPVAQGTDDNTLKGAIGHYEQTALPGGIGNFSIAGHDCCASNGQPFNKLSNLRKDDMIFVYTKTATYSYSVVDDTACGVSPSVVPMTKIEVINPTPCSTKSASQQLMTLQTCTPVTHGHSQYRVMVWAQLRSTVER